MALDSSEMVIVALIALVVLIIVMVILAVVTVKSGSGKATTRKGAITHRKRSLGLDLATDLEEGGETGFDGNENAAEGKTSSVSQQQPDPLISVQESSFAGIENDSVQSAHHGEGGHRHSVTGGGKSNSSGTVSTVQSYGGSNNQSGQLVSNPFSSLGGANDSDGGSRGSSAHGTGVGGGDKLGGSGRGQGNTSPNVDKYSNDGGGSLDRQLSDDGGTGTQLGLNAGDMRLESFASVLSTGPDSGHARRESVQADKATVVSD